MRSVYIMPLIFRHCHCFFIYTQERMRTILSGFRFSRELKTSWHSVKISIKVVYTLNDWVRQKV